MYSFEAWMQTAAAHYSHAWRLQQLECATADCCGYFGVQLGFADYAGLQFPSMRSKMVVVPSKAELPPKHSPYQVLVADFTQLPFAENSVDLVVMPHTLEFVAHPDQVLAEVQRVLIPDGRVVIFGFNPYSLWMLRYRLSLKKSRTSSVIKPIALFRLKEWLVARTFEIDRGRFGIYNIPFSSNKRLQQFQALEKAGDRWWPTLGGFYMIAATKRVVPLRLIPLQEKKRSKKASAARVPAAAHRELPPISK